LLQSNALKASLERSDLAATNDSPYDALFRATVRKDAKQGDASDVSAQQQLDTITLRPSWLVHSDPKNQYPLHKYSSERAEEDLSNTHGLDILTGMTRDWNEEFQSAREIPCETLGERIERARIVHKTLMDFGDAALAGAEAIFKGQIAPMNPNEQSRAHVYLHNNIFFSRAIDSGVDTFKIGQGDSCARKAASRDASCVGTFHRLDISGLNTLATVLIDYLGTRLTCQSIVPGILQGEKTHEILYGAVEATAPLSFNKDFHDILDSKLGKGLMIATRNVNKSPLTEERIDFIKERKINPVGIPLNNLDEERETEDTDGVTPFFGAIELKGIKGSDQRTYCLDISRLTPRDANWVAKESGGTGNYDTTESKKTSVIPDTLEDDEWTSAILRPELITQITHTKMRKWIESKKQKENDDKDTSEESEEKPKPPKPVESEYIDSLRMNLNVFLPHVKGSKDMAIEDADQLKKDEELVREAASYLWDTVLPRITKDIRTNVGSSIPVDGRSLTEFLHQRGVNCRYLGRLAQLALDEENNVKQEEKAVSEDSASKLNRYKMPECWLEILECEMIARAAKHVLDRYLTENGCFAASQPASEISSFLSALMITSEESAAETENRKRKDGIDDEILALTTLNINDDKAPTRGHKDIWNDIEKEIGHRFRYTLQTFNSNDSRMAKRAQYIPLLRRFCQKAGIRLKARNYIVGEKGLVSSEISYPIAVSDIVEVVPLIKHAASSGDDGFVSCTAGASAASTSLHVLLPEAKAAFDAAQMQLNEKQFANALDLAQEASTLYQRAIESPFHNRVYRCLELTSIILFQAEEFDHALANAKKALTIAIQIFGFDSKQALTSRTTLSHILLTIGAIKSAVKQQRATMYLMELMAGPRYVELSNSYHKLGTMYHEVGSLINALRLYQEAFGRNNPDRVIEGMLSKHSASILASLGQYKPALETEKRTYEMFRLALGEDHELTKNSMQLLKVRTKHI
jgi:protein TIF31